MKNQTGRSVLVASLVAVILLAFIYYLYVNADRYINLLRLSLPGLATMFLLNLLFPIMNGMQNTFLYRALGNPNFSHRDGILIAAASTIANQLPIPGGIVSKGLYLKHKYGLSYTLFLSSTVALFACFLAESGLVGILTLAYLAVLQKTSIPAVLWVGFGLMTACMLIFLFPVDRIPLPTGVHNRLQSAVDGWMVLIRNPAMLLKILGVQLIFVVVLAFRYQLAFSMLSQHVSLAQVLLMSNASILTQLVSLAPGGLGIREAIVGSVASVLGFDTAVSVAAVALDRLVATLVIIVSGGISTVILGRQIAAPRVEPSENPSK